MASPSPKQVAPILKYNNNNNMRRSFEVDDTQEEVLGILRRQGDIAEAPIQPSFDHFQQLYLTPRISCDILETKHELIQEWNRIFGNKLVSGERLLRVFRCAIAKPALLEGKFWVSDYHVGFKLNWPGQTCIFLEYSSIIDIRKVSFANIVRNAIEIETESETFFFGSLTARGEKFNLLNQIWDQHVQPTSLFRKYPDVSVAMCACGSSGSCGYCVKLSELKRLDSVKRKPAANKKMYDYEDSNIPVLHKKLSQSHRILPVSRSMVEEVLLDEENAIVEEKPSDSAALPEILVNEDSSIPATLSNSSLNTLNQQYDASECRCSNEGAFEKIFESELDFSIETLWREWFCTPTEGNTFLRFLLNEQSVTSLEIAPWATPGDTKGEETVPLDQIGCDGNFCPEFSSVKSGMYRKSTRVLPLKHSIPFVPKSTPGANNWSILAVGAKNLCIRNEATIYLMGIVTDVKICLEETGLNKSLLKVYVNLIFTGRGKINVPKSLAEKGTMDGIKLFYTDLVAYFSKNIENTIHILCTCEKMADKEGLKPIYQSEYLPISIEDLWSQLFLVPIAGNTFTKYIESRAGWNDVQYTTWKTGASEESEFVSRENAKNPGYTLPLNQILPEMSRIIKYGIINQDPIPFVPTSLQSTTKHTVIQSSPHNICLLAETSIADFGIESYIRICISTLGPLKTKIRVLGSVNVTNGKYPLPASWKNAFQKFQIFYSDLFGTYLMSSRSMFDEPSLKTRRLRDLRKSSSKDLPSSSLKKGKLHGFWNLSILRRQFSEYATAFLFVMLFLNTLILWNLVVAAERQKLQIFELKKSLNELK